MERNTVIHGDCHDVLPTLEEGSVDMVVTSPPYDGLREYGDEYDGIDLPRLGRQLDRVLTDGGVCVLVIQDQTVDGAKSLTSFRTAVDWVDNTDLRLFETVIYGKHGNPGAWWTDRFRVDHEYMFVFVKGEDGPQHFDKEHLKIETKHGGKEVTTTDRLADGSTTDGHEHTINEKKCRGTIWRYDRPGEPHRRKSDHPATFQEELAEDFIRCFCPDDGLVLDPMFGSGTVGVAAKENGYDYLGIEVVKEYVELAEERLERAQLPLEGL